jgi:hypothetical protein
VKKTSWVLLLARLFAIAPNLVIGYSVSDSQLFTQICTSEGILDISIDGEGVTSDSASIVPHGDHCAFCSVITSASESDSHLSYFFNRFRKFQQYEQATSKGLLFLISHPSIAPPTIS